MYQASAQAYWEHSFKTLYDAWYQELISEALVVRWERIDVVTVFLAALTASGSAVAGWTLWTLPGWRVVWVIFAGVAAIACIAHSALRVPTRVKEQADFRKAFAELRVDLETFRHQLVIGLPIDQVRTKYDELRKRLSELTGRTHPDMTCTKGFYQAVQEQLNMILKNRGYVQ